MLKIKICFVTTSPLIIQFFLKNLLHKLADDYDITVIFRKDADYQLISGLGKHVKLEHININRKIKIFSDIFVLFKLIFHFRKNKYDVVHTIAPKAGLLGQLAAFICCVKVRLHTFQGEVWATMTGSSRLLFRMLDWTCSTLSTHSLVVSKSERDFLVQQGVLCRNKSTVLANGSISGIDLNYFKGSFDARAKLRSQFGYKSDDVVLLYVGRLNTDKGIGILLTAFDSIAQKTENVKLIIVGRDEESWTTQISNSRFISKIRYVGFQEDPRVFYQASDILCLPSKREGFGMVILEAAAYKLPSVCTRIYGITDAVVEDKSGLLFESTAEFIEKLYYLIINPQLRYRLGNFAYERVKDSFDQNILISEYKKLYLNMVVISNDKTI